MGRRSAWLLNFEADLELAQDGAFTPGREVAKLVASLRARHAAQVMGPEDVEIDEHAELAPGERGLPGRAWCPTPRALAAIDRAGARVPRAPALEVLRRVNSRAFNAALGQTLPGAVFVRELEHLQVELGSRPSSSAWLLKRAHSVAGRGQRRVLGGELSGPDQVWARGALRQGGLQLEPRLELELELVLHGHLSEGGDLQLGPVCVQECDAQGAWQRTRPSVAAEVEPGECAAIEAEGERVGHALDEAGYFGPFGLDAFRWIDEQGQRRLQPRSEINARYTLGWRVGFPGGEPD